MIIVIPWANVWVETSQLPGGLPLQDVHHMQSCFQLTLPPWRLQLFKQQLQERQQLLLLLWRIPTRMIILKCATSHDGSFPVSFASFTWCPSAPLTSEVQRKSIPEHAGANLGCQSTWHAITLIKTLHLPGDLIKAASAVMIRQNGALARRAGPHHYLGQAEEKGLPENKGPLCDCGFAPHSLGHCSSFKRRACHNKHRAKCSWSTGPGNLAACLCTQKYSHSFAATLFIYLFIFNRCIIPAA